MNAVIVEDEWPAFQELSRLIQQVAPHCQVVKQLTSIEEAVEWFPHNSNIDLIFMDIQLSDGLSFSIFDEITLSAPIIFTTAFDQYALRAFQVRGVDYLLKPIDPLELKQSIAHVEEKAVQLTRHDLMDIRQAVQFLKPIYKTRFTIRTGTSLKLIDVGQISFFEVEGNYVTLYDVAARKFIVDYRMEELTNLLAPNDFFRVSRQHIVNVKAIREIESYPGGRLAIRLVCQSPKPILVSASRIREFRQWLEESA
ncbi:LytTR family DNA-binding domain-containing protein [Larkinella knui]|uniref:DNA-binding response regulator n=1 Tax=Larkinella knui TaxID=2025310 RepID=A0A3P1CL22_9BACT|nr:LytTR family DNA-binding domain-containing protein [Larkinella knui]RRB13890.1 DNA-binding response regulator [Larkinella knui]